MGLFSTQYDEPVYQEAAAERKPDFDIMTNYGGDYLVFVSFHSLKTREKYTNWDNLVCLSLYIFWGQSHLCLLLQNTFFCKSK